MGNIVLSIVLCLMLPVLLLSVLLDKKPRRIMASFLAGIVMCLVSFFVNTLLMESLPFDGGSYTVTVSPVIEELLKFIPILVFSLMWKRGLHGTASVAFAVGVGFCVVENFYYIVSGLEEVSILWVVVRCVGTGLMHSMSATVIGLGIYFGRLQKRMTVQCVTGTLFFSIIYHGLFNLLVSSERFQIVGIILPVVTYLVVVIFLNKNELAKLLPESAPPAKE